MIFLSIVKLFIIIQRIFTFFSKKEKESTTENCIWKTNKICCIKKQKRYLKHKSIEMLRNVTGFMYSDVK